MNAYRALSLVSALGAAQSVAIVTQVGALGAAGHRSVFGAGETAQIVTGLLAVVFLTVAITVSAVVVTGAAEVLLAGQVRTIALRRLLGSSARAERQRLTRSVLRHGVLGVVLGAVVGYAVSVPILALGLTGRQAVHLDASDVIPSPLLVIALAAQLAVTALAARRGTRGVLAVPPVAALRLAADADSSVPATVAVRGRSGMGVLVVGVALLGYALFWSRQTPLAMLPAVLGGVVSFVGVVSVGHRVVPPLLRGATRLLPRTTPAANLAVTLAGRGLARHPERSARAVLGVAGAVTLVTTFAVGIATFEQAVRVHYTGSKDQAEAFDAATAVSTVVLVLTAFLGVTAAVALANAVAFGARQRGRETALLRVLGQAARETRTTILAQSLLLGLAAIVIGLPLGLLYGWLGAQAVFGSETAGNVVPLHVPLALVLGTAVALAVLTLAASVAPIRAALRRPPIRAYLEA